MAKTHKISWTEKTWNPVTGCTKIATGCKNCYAEAIAKRFWGDRKFTDVKVHYRRLLEPTTWRKPRLVFVNSMSDLFHEKIAKRDITRIYRVMAGCDKHIFQVLTKRPERAQEFYSVRRSFTVLPNVWFGVSVSTQEDADKNIPILLDTPAAVRWVSLEPMLGEVDLSDYLYSKLNCTNLEFYCPKCGKRWQRGGHKEGFVKAGAMKHVYACKGKNDRYLDWVVIGCESGPNKRACKIEWVESIVEQCKSAGVPVFVKQLNIGGKVVKNIEKFPEHLRIREFPKSQEHSATD